MKLAADLRGANVDGQTKSLESEKVDAPVIDTIEQIRLENISYTYPKSRVPALKNISIQIDKGEHVGIVGSSGAGKTTLVDTLLGCFNRRKVAFLSTELISLITQRVCGGTSLICPRKFLLSMDLLSRTLLSVFRMMRLTLPS